MPSDLGVTEICQNPITCWLYPHLCTGQEINIHKCELHFTGKKTTWLVHNANSTLVQGFAMNRGRWYPTVLRAYTQPHYAFVAFSGHPAADDPLHDNHSIEFSSQATFGTWVQNGVDLPTTDLYPRAFVTPYDGGSIVVASPRNVHPFKSTSVKPVVQAGAFTGQFTVTDIPNAALDPAQGREFYHHFHSSAVLLPLRPNSSGVYPKGRILMTNDAQPIILNLNDASPAWRNTAARANPVMRMNANSTLLATGDVLVTGGVDDPGFLGLFAGFNDGWDGTENRSVNTAEIYREEINGSAPNPGRWDEGPVANISRNYHSTALLLPDGSVLLAGGNKHALNSRWNQPSGEGRVLQTEIFMPWYALPEVSRPSISDTTPNPPRSGNWTITTGTGTPGTSITRVALIAPGSVTHAFNVDQRYVELRIVPNTATATTVRVAVPGDHYVLPSGWYMLFISRSSGGDARGAHIPSVAKWVRVP
jgi:hypothetical protein